MATLTLELPDDLAETLDALPADERNNFAVALMREGLAAREEGSAEEADPDLIAALQAGIADMEAGNVLTLDEMETSFAEREAQVLAKQAVAKMGR